MSRRVGSRIKTVGEAVEDLIEKLGIKKRIQEYEAVMRWEEIVGNQIARVTTARRIAKGILVVEVKSGAWRNELSLRKKEIMEKLNGALGENVVVDIRFH